jgi:hypothetical protein
MWKNPGARRRTEPTLALKGAPSVVPVLRVVVPGNLSR